MQGQGEVVVQGQRLLCRVNMAVVLQIAAFVMHIGLALSPWVRTSFTRLQSLCVLITTRQVCSALTNISVFSIGPFINAVCFLALISLWKYLGLLETLHALVQGRKRLWQFSPYTLLIVILMPCSLSYMGWLFMYVHEKWTGDFLDVIQILHLLTSLVFALHTIIVGLYFIGAFSFPAALKNAIQTHRNHFRAHIVTLQTLNVALISYCVSVLTLLGSEDDVPEKQDAIHSALAEILYRLVCVVAARVLQNTCEAALDGDNISHVEQSQNQVQCINDSQNNHHGNEFQNVMVPVNDHLNAFKTASTFAVLPTNSPDSNLQKISPHVDNSPHLSSDTSIDENHMSVRELVKESYILPFWSPNPPDNLPPTLQLADDVSVMTQVAGDSLVTPHIVVGTLEIPPIVLNALVTPQMPSDTLASLQATSDIPASLQAKSDTLTSLQATDDTPATLQATDDTPETLQATDDTPETLQATDDTPKTLQATD